MTPLQAALRDLDAKLAEIVRPRYEGTLPEGEPTVKPDPMDEVAREWCRQYADFARQVVR